VKSVINQHNYEEIFLLYVDGELSATDKLAVEQFVQANPGLADELEMLQQMQLPAEQFVFTDKNSLYRNEAQEINLANCEEHFLLYIDNELNSEAKLEVETFVLQHPSVQEAFTVLKQVKLEPEMIAFPGKQSLYRNEKKERPVFYMRWQRIAVAAAILGFTVLLWTQFTPNKKTVQPLAKLEQRSSGINRNSNLSSDNNNTAVTNLANRGNTVPGNTAIQNPVNTNVNTSIPVNNTDLSAQTDVPVRQTESIEKTTAGAENIETATAPIQKLAFENTATAGMEMVKADSPDGINSGPSANDNVQPAVYKELDTESNDEKKSLLLGSLEINKDKLRGFFRKAGSLFRGKAKADDDKTGNHPSSNTRSLK
jgi:hypothetical protein